MDCKRRFEAPIRLVVPALAAAGDQMSMEVGSLHLGFTSPPPGSRNTTQLVYGL